MNDQLKADIKELSFAAGIADTFHGRNCCAALDRIEEALERGTPEGWQLVPKTPYIRMIDAGEIHASSNIEDLVSECRSRAVRVYEAMLFAAPKPPQERKD